MFKSLNGKLTLVLVLLFGGISGGIMLIKEKMPEAHRLLELASDVVIGSIAFSLLAALLVFSLLTRRLRLLNSAVDAFRAGRFANPIRMASANPAGDEIDRLGAAFEEMSERISAQIKQLEHNDLKRRELLANVSHDLRTPLASMRGYLETLLLKHGTLASEEERNYLEVAAKHSERLASLVSDLFELTKLEANEVSITAETFPISELAQDVAQQYQLPAQKRGLRLEARIAESVPPVHADIGMIERVLENLVENALRHTPAGGSVRIELRPLGERVEVAVKDTGQGIPSDELANVFERYYRIDRGEFGSTAHAGLGLAITRRVVELHGGTIRVASQLGQGTTFSFDLPAARM